MAMKDLPPEVKELFEVDKETFEEKRKALLEGFFSSLTPENQVRYRAQQWALEQKLRHYKDPKVRMEKMWDIFNAQLQRFNAGLKEFVRSID